MCKLESNEKHFLERHSESLSEFLYCVTNNVANTGRIDFPGSTASASSFPQICNRYRNAVSCDEKERQLITILENAFGNFENLKERQDRTMKNPRRDLKGSKAPLS